MRTVEVTDELQEYLDGLVKRDAVLKRMEESFGGDVRAYVPEMERDITGLRMIERLAQRLFVDGEGRTS